MFFSELVDLLRLAQVLKAGFLVLVVLELFNQLLDLVFGNVYPAFRLSKGYARNSVVNSVVRGFPCNSSIRWVGPKMILRLGLVDLVDRCANSL